jgi:hypothetical protein
VLAPGTFSSGYVDKNNTPSYVVGGARLTTVFSQVQAQLVYGEQYIYYTIMFFFIFLIHHFHHAPLTLLMLASLPVFCNNSPLATPSPADDERRPTIKAVYKQSKFDPQAWDARTGTCRDNTPGFRFGSGLGPELVDGINYNTASNIEFEQDMVWRDVSFGIPGTIIPTSVGEKRMLFLGKICGPSC